MSPRYLKITIIVLVVVLVVLAVFLALQYRSLRREQVLSARELWLDNVLKRHGPPTASDVDVLRSWMTFAYINQLFDVPSAYLKDEVPVNDARYPQISIGSYARENNMNVNAFLGTVENALKAYLTPTSTPGGAQSI